jgi:hypothetical protein
MEKMTKELLGLASEYAVAAQLCRLGMYAQLTLGHHKRTDILVETETRMLRIQVKGKQSYQWPALAGPYRQDDFLVLVDFQKKGALPPDFYVLDVNDWKLAIKNEKKIKPITVDSLLRVTYPDGWKGLNLSVGQVIAYRDQWNKVASHLTGNTVINP